MVCLICMVLKKIGLIETCVCLLFYAGITPLSARTIDFKFPDDASYGQLFDNSKVDNAGGSRIEVTRQRLGAAQGHYKLTVPDKHQILFEPNHKLFVSPQKVLQFGPEGIDAIKITFIPMEEKENSYTLALSKNLHHLKYLQDVQFNGTEIGDKEVAALAPLPNLVRLAISRTNISSAVSKGLATLPGLIGIDMAQTDIHGIDFTPMKVIKRLWILQLSNCDIDSDDLKSLGQLTSLGELHLENTRVDDRAMKYLAPLKRLQSLNLSKTRVTIKGVSELKGKNILFLHLPAALNNKTNKTYLASILPLAKVTFDKSNVIKSDKEMNDIFAPLH